MSTGPTDPLDKINLTPNERAVAELAEVARNEARARTKRRAHAVERLAQANAGGDAHEINWWTTELANADAAIELAASRV